jgi:hypothetical protein
MIDILIRGVPAQFFYATDPVSVSRIGDVVLLTKEKENKFQCRVPWVNIFEAKEIESIGGSLLDRGFDIIRTRLNKFDIETFDSIIGIFKEKNITLSILQGIDKLSLCVVNGKFCGYKMDSEEIILDFDVLKSEMIYNQ